jgi:hypothetical protein
MHPSATDVQSRKIGSQNSHEPHFEQNPLRTFSEDWYQVRFSAPVISSEVLGRFAPAKKWPDCFLQRVQWQAVASVGNSLSEKLTALQLQEPLMVDMAQSLFCAA